MIQNILITKEQGSDFGSNTRQRVGGAIESPMNILPDDLDLASAIAHWADIFAGLATIIAVGALIWGGVLWASSVGDEEKIEKAKTVIKLTLFGLILTLLAWTIVGFVTDNFG